VLPREILVVDLFGRGRVRRRRLLGGGKLRRRGRGREGEVDWEEVGVVFLQQQQPTEVRVSSNDSSEPEGVKRRLTW